MDRIYRVGITGSYGGLNLGDEAILASIISQLRRSLPVEITVFSRNAEDTLARHRVDRAVPVRHLNRKEVRPDIERLDLLIFGGGGILFDREAHVFLREVQIAQDLGIPVMVYAVSAGPLEDPAAQRLVRECLDRAEVVTVRDRHAQKLLEEIGIHRSIEVTADPALLLEAEPLPAGSLIREGLDRRRRLVGFSVREPGPAAPDLDAHHYHALLANTADFIVDRYDADIVFIPLERDNLDLQHSHAVIAQMGFAHRASVLKGEYTSGQLLTLMDHFSFVVGMRLHVLIFAALRCVPFVALPYAAKVAGFLEALEISMPPIQVVTPGRVIAHVDRWWDAQDELRERIDQRLPALQERSRRTNQIAIDLLTEHHHHSGRAPHGTDIAA